MRVTRRQWWFDRVKIGGDQHGRIGDAMILSMFASDKECISRLHALAFDMVSVTPELAEHVSQLKNVNNISFYDTRGTDRVLANARSLPIQQIFFHQADVSPESLRRLADFPALNAVYVQQVPHPDVVDALDSLPPNIVACGFRREGHVDEGH